MTEDPKGKDEDNDEKQDEKEILRSEKEGFGTIAEGYRSEGEDDEEKSDKE